MNDRLVYKAVRSVGNELWSLTDTAYSIRYELGKNIKGAFPIFAFDSFQDAFRFDKKNEIYTAIATNVRVIKVIQTDTASPVRSHRIELFWRDYLEYGMAMARARLSYGQPPAGTLICDSIQLLKRVYKYEQSY